MKNKAYESLTTAIRSITTDHGYIHEGIGFKLVGSISLASTASSVISITTPASKYIHYRPAGISTTASAISFSLAEGATVTGGTPATPINRNRNRTNPSACTVKTAVTVSVAGAEIDLGTVGSGGNPARVGGGQTSETQEIVLKPSTTYTLTFTNLTTTATVAYFDLFWYEETGGA